MEYILVLLN